MNLVPSKKNQLRVLERRILSRYSFVHQIVLNTYSQLLSSLSECEYKDNCKKKKNDIVCLSSYIM